MFKKKPPVQMVKSVSRLETEGNKPDIRYPTAEASKKKKKTHPNLPLGQSFDSQSMLQKGKIFWFKTLPTASPQGQK